MFVITNRIKTQKGFAKHMAPTFTANQQIHQFDGFIKTEVLVCNHNKDFDEMNVNMYWETLESFRVWRESDAFKNAHKQPTEGKGSKESPILGSEIIISELASTTEK
ncbi:heme oxygenase (staphylobilin-producing) [Seinonella peptonophila]|uniref:Heme oxygenase (Staphylobilin-producing) n=1 Tax=Seinonella peptonophila TaxID=112248 RepID=A0A1M4YSL2_9BACL|nr:heme oxygenase [Seinonella peptonophila]SHF08809.1 heme oxygenase (staphylobilin-producing) [Seinonella peptonophila]